MAAEFASDDAQVRAVVEQNLDLVLRLAALSELRVASGRLDPAASAVRATAQFDVRIVTNRGRRRAGGIGQLRKERERLTNDIESKQKRLADETFRSRAPDNIVKRLEATLAERRIEIGKVERAPGATRTDRRRFSRGTKSLSSRNVR